MTKKSEFLKRSGWISFDRQHRKTLQFNIGKYEKAFETGRERYSDFSLAKRKASLVKEDVLFHWADYLEKFEENFLNHGGEIIWASNSKEANDSILKICREVNAKMVVKSKSMTTEEIELNDHLESAGIESVETDLGEFIVQVAGEKPYHIVTPAMHKSKRDVAELFHQKFDLPVDSTPRDMTLFVRSKLREKFVTADIGITGANFLVADPGGIALTENEGNGLMTTSFPKVHIVIAGIEKIIPTLEDLGHFWPLLSAHGTGQKMTVYNSFFSGPGKKDETDGPERMIVILLDNGRSDLYASKEQYQALKCIRCGACLNFCPIYRNIGGYTYDAVYTGPIGSVITPFYNGFVNYKHLSFACSVCGRCSENCPVQIPLHELLLANRRMSVEQGGDFKWNTGMKTFENIFLDRSRLDLIDGQLKNIAVKTFAKNTLGKHKQMPEFSKESFSRQWKKKK